MSPWLIIVMVGLGTYLTRLSFVAIFADSGVPQWLEAPLRYVAPAVIAAIVLPRLVAPEGSVDLTLDNLRWIAGLAAIGVAFKTRSLTLTIVIGMVALWILQALL